jgi:hypothetical protein
MAMVSFLSTLRARAMGNSFRVMTFSLVPPKSIIAIINLSSLGIGSMFSVRSNELLILTISARQSNANASPDQSQIGGKDLAPHVAWQRMVAD